MTGLLPWDPVVSRPNTHSLFPFTFHHRAHILTYPASFAAETGMWSVMWSALSTEMWGELFWGSEKGWRGQMWPVLPFFLLPTLRSIHPKTMRENSRGLQRCQQDPWLSWATNSRLTAASLWTLYYVGKINPGLFKPQSVGFPGAFSQMHFCLSWS